MIKKRSPSIQRPALLPSQGMLATSLRRLFMLGVSRSEEEFQIKWVGLSIKSFGFRRPTDPSPEHFAGNG